MKAIIQNTYGSPEALELNETDKPEIKDNQVLVRVRAGAVHAGDYFCTTGDPYLVRMAVGWPKPKKYVPGYDVAGEVEAVGAGVTRFKPGDEVFGSCVGSCAEFVAVNEEHLVPKPANLTFEQAGAIATSALAALHGLRDAGKLQPGQKVLINGASGGVGHYAVQIAKTLGAEVTGVCSTKNVEMVKSLGADHVVDYTQEDFTQNGQRYDLILDNVANRSFSECRRALTPDGKYIPNSGNGGMGLVIMAMVRSLFQRQQGRPYLSAPNQEDLNQLSDLAESGQLKPVIEKTYELAETGAAIAHVGGGHASGKVVISL